MDEFSLAAPPANPARRRPLGSRPPSMLELGSVAPRSTCDESSGTADHDMAAEAAQPGRDHLKHRQGRSRPVSRVLFRGPRGPRRRTFLSGARCRAPPASSTRRLDRAGLDPLALARGSTAVALRRRRSPPYSLLHRVGFAMPRRLPGVRCALTAPFHPCHALLAEPFGGLLSVALSCGSPRPVVNRHPALWCSDFPRRLQPCKPTRSPERLRRGGCNTRVPGWQTRRSYRRSSMALLLISSAAAFSSRGMCATRTSGKARSSCFASSWSGFRWSAFTA